MRFSKMARARQRLPARSSGLSSDAARARAARRLCDVRVRDRRRRRPRGRVGRRPTCRDRDLEPRRLARPSSPATGRASRRAGSRGAAATPTVESSVGGATYAAPDAGRTVASRGGRGRGRRAGDDRGRRRARSSSRPSSVGNPHAVVAREPDADELLRLGPLLETRTRASPSGRTSSSSASTDAHEITRRRLGARRGGDVAPPARARSRSPRPRSRTAGARARSRFACPAASSTSPSPPNGGRR